MRPPSPNPLMFSPFIRIDSPEPAGISPLSSPTLTSPPLDSYFSPPPSTPADIDYIMHVPASPPPLLAHNAGLPTQAGHQLNEPCISLASILPQSYTLDDVSDAGADTMSHSGAANGRKRSPPSSSSTLTPGGTPRPSDLSDGSKAAIPPAKRPRAAPSGPISTKDWVPPDVTGLGKREARLVKNRAAAFLSRQRKREEFEQMEIRVAQLEAENARLQGLRSGSAPEDELRTQLQDAQDRQHLLEAQVHRLQSMLDARNIAEGPIVKHEQVDDDDTLLDATPEPSKVSAVQPHALRNPSPGPAREKERDKSPGVALTFVILFSLSLLSGSARTPVHRRPHPTAFSFPPEITPAHSSLPFSLGSVLTHHSESMLLDRPHDRDWTSVFDDLDESSSFTSDDHTSFGMSRSLPGSFYSYASPSENESHLGANAKLSSVVGMSSTEIPLGGFGALGHSSPRSGSSSLPTRKVQVSVRREPAVTDEASTADSELDTTNGTLEAFSFDFRVPVPVSTGADGGIPKEPNEFKTSSITVHVRKPPQSSLAKAASEASSPAAVAMDEDVPDKDKDHGARNSSPTPSLDSISSSTLTTSSSFSSSPLSIGATKCGQKTIAMEMELCSKGTEDLKQMFGLNLGGLVDGLVGDLGLADSNVDVGGWEVVVA